MNRYYFSGKKQKTNPHSTPSKKKADSNLEEEFLENIMNDKDVPNDRDDYNNNEYFLYSDISVSSVMSLLKFIKNAEKRWNAFLADYDDLIETADPKPLKIYINSNGGEIFAAIPLIDAIKNCSIPVYTYIEGIAASAASLISMAGHKRFITKNSFMLIHELRSGVEGKYSDIMDEKENCDKLMNVIRNIYLERTGGKLTKQFLDKTLKRDILLSSDECATHGLIDEII
jgi:ATP-dependent Clp endopeptidase proteolytic subunit ClpP